MFWFIVLLLLAGAGFYFYQKMMAIEREIRSEQEADSGAAQVVAKSAQGGGTPEPEVVEQKVSESTIVTPEVEKMTTKAEPVADDSSSLEDEILAAVKNLPGIKQTELYTSFADINRKQLQQMLKEMDENGKLKREKKGSSYLLYPA
jgi:CHASE3 domain sensor protein